MSTVWTDIVTKSLGGATSIVFIVICRKGNGAKAREKPMNSPQKNGFESLMRWPT